MCRQSVQPDEIVLIAHNCTDRTVSIASEYPLVSVIEYDGPKGLLYARIKGFETVTGDIIANTDADSVLDPYWFERITKPLKQNAEIVGVGTNMLSVGNIWQTILSYKYILINQRLGLVFNKPSSRYFIGPSFAIRKKEYNAVGTLTPLIQLVDELGLEPCQDDVYLSMLLSQRGKLEFIRDILVKTVTKEKTLHAIVQRSRKDKRTTVKLNAYFHTK